MATESNSSSGIYVYAVVSGKSTVEYGATGLDGAEVFRIVLDDLTALCSATAHARVRPERRHLAAHNQVLRRSLDEQAVLPMAFGLIASSHDAVIELLTRNRKALREQLDRVSGKIEMGLRVLYDVPNVFEYFVNTRPELRDARDALGDIRHASHGEMLALGQLFERTLTSERDAHYESVRAILERHGVILKRNPPRHEREVMNLACLIPREMHAGFEGIVGEAAAAFDNHFSFDMSGPWAPHNFVELNLRS